MPFTAPSVKKSKFLPVPFLSKDIAEADQTAATTALSRQALVFRCELEALGEAVFAGDHLDAIKRLNFFRGVLASAINGVETVWQDLEQAAQGRLRERTIKGLLEAAFDTPGIPWKETDKRILFLARALQENKPAAEEHKNYFLGLCDGGEPLFTEAGLEQAYHFVDACCSRLDWENPYAAKERVNEAVTFAMERLAAAVSRYLAAAPPENDPRREDIKQFFRFLAQDERLMFVIKPTDDGEPVSGLKTGPNSTRKAEELSEQEEQYLGSNAIFYRQMMAKGYLSVLGNIVLGSLALLKDEAARNQFLTAQYRNIGSLAKKYDGPGVERIDLIQTAWVGLEKALQIYEPWKGTLFWTLARKWVFGAIILEFKKTVHFSRILEPVEALDGESYLEALESLIAGRGLIPGPNGLENTASEFSPEEARQFVSDLIPLLDDHDKTVLLAWIKEPNIVKVAERFETSKQNISNALGRIHNAGRQLAHERRMLPPSTWNRFRRAELAVQTQRLLQYAEKKAAEGDPSSPLRLKGTLKLLVPALRPSQKPRPLLAAEKAGLLAITQRHFDEDAEGKAKAIKQYRDTFLSGKEKHVQYYISDLAQRLDFETDSFKDQFFNFAILELLQSLSWKYKTEELAEAAIGVVEEKILKQKEPPYCDVVLAARRFLEAFPARNKTPELEKRIQETLRRLPRSS